MTVTRERTEGTGALGAEVLFEEARVLRRQRWGRVGRFSVVAAIGIAAGIVLTSGGGPALRPVSVHQAEPGSLVTVQGRDGTATITLPSTLPFTSFTAEPGHLLFFGTGENQDASGCLVGTLDLSTARLTNVDVLNAEDSVGGFGACEGNAGTPVGYLNEPGLGDSGMGNEVVRVITAVRDGLPVYGPPILSFSPCSDCDPRVAQGDGSIWIFAPGPSSRVFRVSPTTGRVLNTIPIANSDRPLLASNADGLWMVFTVEGDYGGSLPKGETPLIHIAPGSNVAEVRALPGYAASWIVAEGHSVWVGSESPFDPGSAWVSRFDGAAEAEKFQRPITNDTFKTGLGGLGGTVVGNASEGLWTTVTVAPKPTLASPAYLRQTATALDVVRIDPSTGAIRLAAKLQPPDLPEYDTVSSGQIGVDDGDVYILISGDSSNPTSRLYRVAI
jgi:hypothetical protein